MRLMFIYKFRLWVFYYFIFYLVFGLGIFVLFWFNKCSYFMDFWGFFSEVMRENFKVKDWELYFCMFGFYFSGIFVNEYLNEIRL